MTVEMTHGLGYAAAQAQHKQQWNFGLHTCALTHDCPSTTVNHRCECGEEYGPELHLAVNHFVSTGDVRPVRDLILSWVSDGPAHSPDAQPGKDEALS